LSKVLLFGSSGHAKSCVDLIESTETFVIKGVVTREKSKLSSFMGYDVTGTDESIAELVRDCPQAVIGVGQIKDAGPRIGLFLKLMDFNAEMPVIVSPYSKVSRHSSLGDGSLVFHHAVVNASAVVGKNCILNNKSLIEHDAVIEDHCHISTGAIVNGGAKVGRECFVGSGAILHEGVCVGENSIIGAGKVVREDVEPGSIYK